MISNIDIYLAIAEESLAESERIEKFNRSPKPGNEPGFIIKYDPEKKSFKMSLIAIAFAGMYLDALFYIEGTRLLGGPEYLRIDGRGYKSKLCKLGLTDSDLLRSCERFTKIRNDLSHEKAIQLADMTKDKIHFAQTEARIALSFVRDVAMLLTKMDRNCADV